MVLLNLICYSSVAIAVIIGVLKNSQMLRDKEARTALIEEYRIKRIFRFLFIPTFYGWLFIECVVLAMILFVIKDTITKSELENWQKKTLSLAVSNKAATAKEEITASLPIAEVALVSVDSITTTDTPAIRQLALKTPTDSMTAEQKNGAFITLYGDDVTDSTKGDNINMTLPLMNDGLGVATDVNIKVMGVYEFDTHSYVNIKVSQAEKSIMKSADTVLAYCHFSKRKVKLKHMSLYCKISYITNGNKVKRTVLLSYSDEQKWNYKGENEIIINYLRTNDAL